MTKDISKKIGQCIRTHRNIQKLSQETLAERAELTANYLGQIERGEKNPTVYMLQKITNALDIPMSTIIIESEDVKPNVPSIEHLRINEYLRKFSPEKVAAFQNFLESVDKE